MTANNSRRTAQPGVPALIEHNKLRFLIVNNPSPASLPQFIKELKKNKVKVVVRCCDPTYRTEPLTEEGINVVDCVFDDGATPPPDIVTRWLDLVIETFQKDPDACIAVHCVAGLGRAPALVAIALIEHGMKYHAAVEYIRQKRRGAINKKQLEFLERYKPSRRTSCSLM